MGLGLRCSVGQPERLPLLCGLLTVGQEEEPGPVEGQPGPIATMIQIEGPWERKRERVLGGQPAGLAAAAGTSGEQR